jgi:hypothetical protein
LGFGCSPCRTVPVAVPCCAVPAWLPPCPTAVQVCPPVPPLTLKAITGVHCLCIPSHYRRATPRAFECLKEFLKEFVKGGHQCLG